MAAYRVNEPIAGLTAVVTGAYPAAAATNYVAVVKPGPAGVHRCVEVALWPFPWFRRKHRFIVVDNGAGGTCAYHAESCE